MHDRPQGSYVRPDFFDWGVYKAHGELILIATGLLYLACFAACVLLIRRGAERVGYPRAGLVAGLVGLWPMVVSIVRSLDVQLTSAHYQEHVHVPALITVGITIVLAILLRLTAEGLSRLCRGR